VAWTGSGNTVQNPGCLAYLGKSGRLIANTLEGTRLLSAYDAVVIYRNRRVAIERVYFVPSTYPGRWNALINGQDRSREIHFALTGQRLLQDGELVDPYMHATIAASYSDKRHLLLSPYPIMTIPSTGCHAVNYSGEPIRRDFGLDQLCGETAESKAKFEAAVRGVPVTLSFEMTDVDGTAYTVQPDDLVEALHDKSYIAYSSLSDLHREGERGYYYLDVTNRMLHLRYHRSPYPHHFIAIRRSEETILYDGVLGGWSNNAGTNPFDLAQDLKNAQYTDALLLDNGGDCVLSRRTGHDSDDFPAPNGNSAVIPSSLSRETWAGIILYLGQHGGGLEEAGITLFYADAA
jgi:hypothetical protein